MTADSPFSPSLPTPFGAVPTARQLAWHAIEVYGFIHFTINTFTDKEWGYGDESPALFNPTDFDADQIVQTAKSGGLRGLILTCKHHDGFCLWPSEYGNHSVKSSPWRSGKGDIVREISEACARHGLKFGIYLSPWDRNRADYGAPSYLDYFRAQLRELLTDYGPIFEVWFDGANGGDGFYGGARETRRIDNTTYYDWENTWEIVRELQPDACMFSDVGPDIRWCGNESGFAGDPCWSSLDITAGMCPGVADHDYLNRGARNGARWLPAEVDVSTRPGWFYHQTEDDEVKTVRQLRQIYFDSVGRGASLLLNLPPDHRGQIHPRDAENLREWHQFLTATFAADLAQGARVSANNGRREDEKFAPAAVLDGSRETYWVAEEDNPVPEITLELGAPMSFNVLRLREFLPLGQRVDSFALDAWTDGNWREITQAQAIGNCRLLHFADVTTPKIRLRITQCAAPPAISEVALFHMAELLPEPRIARDRDGMISIAGEANEELRYTLDGSVPNQQSALYTAPFSFLLAGTIKARAFAAPNATAPNATAPNGATPSGTVTAHYEISKRDWTILVPADDEKAANAIDENPATLWSSSNADGEAAEIAVDMGADLTLTGFSFLPRQDNENSGTPDQYDFYLSDDGQNWGAPVESGEFANIKANPTAQIKRFAAPLTGRFFRFVARRTVDVSARITLAQIGVTTL